MGSTRGRFQPKDKAGLVNFEEEQFLEVAGQVLARHTQKITNQGAEEDF